METKRSARSRTIVAAAVMAFAGLMTTGMGIAHADTVQTEGSYPTREACHDAGQGVKASTPGNWNNFWCVPDRVAAGSRRLVLSN